MNLILTVNASQTSLWSCCHYWSPFHFWSPFQRDIILGSVNVLKQRKHWYNQNIHSKAFIYSTTDTY